MQLYIIRSDPIESRFAILLEDFAPSQNWRQHRLLSDPATKATLAAFAKLHGFFWRGSSFWQRGGGAAEQLERSVWRSGSYWQPSMQPPEQLDQVAAAWSRHRDAFGPAFSEAKELAGIDLASLGMRLQRVVHRAGQSAHPFNDPESSKKYSSWRTLIHGDAKSANIFLRDSREGQTHVEVGLIDFQWCGFGLAATEVAHHILAAVDMESLSYDGSKEVELLDHYYAHLVTALVEFGAAEDRETATGLLTRASLQDQYEVAILDMCRWPKILNFCVNFRETVSDCQLILREIAGLCLPTTGSASRPAQTYWKRTSSRWGGTATTRVWTTLNGWWPLVTVLSPTWNNMDH